MTEVEEICDRIGVISKGKLIAVGTVEELRDKVREKEGVRYLLEVSGMDVKEVALALEQIGSVHSVEVSDGGIRLLADKDARMEIAEVVKRSGGAVSKFEEERMDLQRVFLKLIGA
jgi:ABC-2 type transport system ATP-binding protein